jgi:hypothetical protein
MTPLDHALSYAALGWRVAPIKPGFKFPKGLDNWQERATTDDATIRKWWGKYPDYGVSIVAGTSATSSPSTSTPVTVATKRSPTSNTNTASSPTPSNH